MPLFPTARILRHATKPAIRTLTTMPTPTSIPLATLGANPAVATAIQALLLPEYDLVHICLSPSTALSELPPLCAGATLSTPISSGLGSNAPPLPAAERRVPRGVIFGGGIADADVAVVIDAVRAMAPEIKMVRVSRDEVFAAAATAAGADAAGGGPPNPGVIAGVLRRKLDGMVEGGEL